MKELIEFVRNHTELTTEDAVELYFDGIVWDVMKDEFEKMTEKQKDELYFAISKVVNG